MAIDRETSVLIVEPNINIQRSYRKQLMHNPLINVVGVCSSFASACSMLSQISCDILFTELDLPDGSGFELLRRAAKDRNVGTSVVVSSSSAVADVIKSIELGAGGYCIKSEEGGCNLTACIGIILSGGSPVSPLASSYLIKALQNDRKQLHTQEGKATFQEEKNPLSPRETEILQLLAKGMSFLEIASVLQISNHTVTAHIKKIYRKLQVHSRGEAVYEATLSGIIGNRN